MIVGVTLVWVPLFICCVIGLTGNTQVSSSIETVADKILDTLNLIKDNAQFAYDSIVVLDPPSAPGFVNLVNAVDDVIGHGNDVKREVQYWDGQREIIVNFGYYLPLVALLFAIIGVVAKLYRFVYLFVMFCFACAFVIWISFAFHMPLDEISKDACNDANSFIADPSTIPGLSSCLDANVANGTFGNVLAGLQHTLTSLKNESALLGVTIDDHLPPALASTVDTVTFLAAFVRNQTRVANATIAALPSSTPGRLEALLEIVSLDIYVDVIERLVVLTSCEYFRSLLDQLLDATCGPLQTGLRDIAATAAAIGVLLIPATAMFMAFFNQLLIKGEGPKILQRGQTKLNILSTDNPAQPLGTGTEMAATNTGQTTAASVGYI